MGESKQGCLRVDFDRRLKLEFHGSKVTTDAGLLAYRELDASVELTEMVGDVLADSRTGKNGRHGMVGQFRQSVFGRLGGYDDVNDANRLGRDPAMRWIVGGLAIKGRAASTSQMGRFEAELLATDENFAALTELSGVWVDKVHDRRSDQEPPRHRSGTSTAQVKTTGGVCLHGGKSGQMAFQPRADLQNQAIGWLRKGYRSLGGGTVIRFLWIWGCLGNVGLDEEDTQNVHRLLAHLRCWPSTALSPRRLRMAPWRGINLSACWCEECGTDADPFLPRDQRDLAKRAWGKALQGAG
jgi:hypothetical protein